MSADRQRVRRSIQRLAETSPGIRKLLDDAENKGAKPRSAGVGGGAGSEEGSNPINETRICCDGSVSDDANPGVDERDTGDDQDGLDSDNPADIDLSGGCLTGVTDCATGQPVCFCGDDFIPPDGWDDPSSPGVLIGWQEGVYWRGGPSSSSSGWSSYLTCSAARAAALSFCTPDSYEPPACPSTANGAYQCSTDEFEETTSTGFGWQSYSCGDLYDAEMCQYTEENPPLADEWPSDSCVNLAIKNDTIVGSKYDPENDGSYSSPREEIQLCDGTNQISLKPSGSSPGGYKTIDAINGGDGYLYNRKHEQIARISGDEYSDPSV